MFYNLSRRNSALLLRSQCRLSSHRAAPTTKTFSFEKMSLTTGEAGSGSSTLPASPVVSDTTLTPCPFINFLVRKMELAGGQGLSMGPDGKPHTVNLDHLVEVAAEYGIDRHLTRFLGKARLEADRQNILLAELKNPNKTPAHLASMARPDNDLGVVEVHRIEKLRTDPTFSTEGRISFPQLHKYQEYCWSLSNEAGFRDRLISSAEVELLWGVFGGYRDAKHTIPLDMVCTFLKDNTLPEHFTPNTTDPVGTRRLFWNATKRAIATSF